MATNSTSYLRRIFCSSLRPHIILSPAQKRAYNSETEENFRWLSSFFATRSPRLLTAADLIDDEVRLHISAIGQYAEIAHGSISPSFVFSHLEELCSPGQPLEDYDALTLDGARLVGHFRGNIADVQGYVSFRLETCQLLVAFSGTSSPAQALKDMKTWKTIFPRDPERSKVHAGFWEMYRGVRSRAYEALRLGFQEYGGQISGIVLTGHSMGCTLCYLLALDLMAEMGQTGSVIRKGITITLALFGSPRLGNENLVRYWRKSIEEYTNKYGKDSFVEYSVKGYNDGVTILPPRSLGFCHLTESPLYLHHGHLYRIPASENEHGTFMVEGRSSDLDNENASSSTSSNYYRTDCTPSRQGKRLERVLWPRGGHNYYNDRDMEKLQRRMKWLNVNIDGEQGWQERYVRHSKEWETKWGRNVNKNDK